MGPFPETYEPQPKRRSAVGMAALAVGLVVVLALGY